MCTLSIIPAPGSGFRVMMNRDEERTRPPGSAPHWHTLKSGARAFHPVDPAGGGTWIAVTTRGLLLALMNGNPEPRPPRPEGALSRGTIIPALLDPPQPDPLNVLARARELPLERFPPFRLVALARIDHPAKGDKPARIEHRLATFVWNGRQAGEELLNPHRPRCFASSGLGDSLVQCRLPLFADQVAERPTPENQSAFHAHTWADRPHLSVMMSRDEARTVSVTTVVIGPDEPTMTSEPIAAR
ncbi:MAG: NRDE family protein [Phycisphaerales bacterium]